MKRTRALPACRIAFAIALAACTSETATPPQGAESGRAAAAPTQPVLSAPAAALTHEQLARRIAAAVPVAELLDGLRARHVRKPVRDDGPLPAGRVAARQRQIREGHESPLAPAAVRALEPVGLHHLRARLPAAAGSAEVDLPIEAQGALVIHDRRSGASIEVTLAGASRARAELADGWVVYRDGHRDGHVLQRVHADGIEDFVAFYGRPTRPELRYRVRLSSGIAGLRLVAGTLELLDAGGAPRLRVVQPELVDAHGETRTADLRVEGCAVDRDPAGPWGRPVTPPGAQACDVVVSWADAGLTHPLLVDPGWTTTASMAVEREDHEMTALSSGKVLVAGGYQKLAGKSGVTLQACELYDAQSGTWASTGSMKQARSQHSLTPLLNGQALVVGGVSKAGVAPAKSSEIYSAGTWVDGPTPGTHRWLHAAAALPNGEVLVVGGECNGSIDGSYCEEDPVTKDFLAKVAERYTGGMFVPAGTLGTPRYRPRLTNLGAKVLVTGGHLDGDAKVPTGAAELWSGSFSPAGATAPRYVHTATALGPAKALLIGGWIQGAVELNSVDLFEITTTTTSWTAKAPLPIGRGQHTATLLASGKVLVAGGGAEQALGSAHLYDPTANAWQSAGTMLPRSGHTAAALPDGKVLVAGGWPGGKSGTKTAQVYDPNTTCGDGLATPPEVCDGAALNGTTCEFLGMSAGTLACKPDCSDFDKSACGPSLCGNGVCGPGETCTNCPADCPTCCGNNLPDASEVCDGTFLAGKSCVSFPTYSAGALACKADCSAFDFSGCTSCGNSVVDPGEECDGPNLDGHSCQSLGFMNPPGQLACTGGCKFDKVGCLNCTEVEPLLPPIPPLVVKYEKEWATAGNGFAYKLEYKIKPAVPEANQCVSGYVFEGGAAFCTQFAYIEDCYQLDVGSEGKCTAQAVCQSPPLATCDLANTLCCQNKLAIGGSYSKSRIIQWPAAGFEYGWYLGGQLQANVGFQFGAQAFGGTQEGPGCSGCPGQAKHSLGVKFKGEIVGGAAASATMLGVNVAFGGSVDGCFEAEFAGNVCGANTYSGEASGGVKAKIHLAQIHFGVLQLHDHVVELWKFPSGFQGCD